MNATVPVKSTAVGLRWPAAKNMSAMLASRSERPPAVTGCRRDQRKMPNGDPPPVTLWGTDPGE